MDIKKLIVAQREEGELAGKITLLFQRKKKLVPAAAPSPKRARVAEPARRRRVMRHPRRAARAEAAGAKLRGEKAHGGQAPGTGKHSWRLNFPTEAEVAAVNSVQ